MAKKRLKKGRVFMTFVLVIGSIVAADSIRRDFFVTPDTTLVITGNFKDPYSPAAPINGDSAAMGGNVQQSSQSLSYIGYSEFAAPASQLSSGLLTIINQEHPSADSVTANGLINLSNVKNDLYSLRSDDLMLNSDAADALNSMMSDYNAATGLLDFIIYSTTQQYVGEDSVCPTVFAESSGGFTIDLAVAGASSTLEYDGADEEAWIIQNCANYGFILRYPQGKEASTGQGSCTWHLRYVGKVHSMLMSQNNLCLEEYINWLKSYTIDTAPLSAESDGQKYEIYYTASMGDTTPVRVPVSGNYTISGNNIDGFIVTAVK